MTGLAQAKFEFDPFSVEAAANLENYYKEMRAHHPVYYNEKYDTFFFSRFNDVWDLLLTGNNTFLATESNLPTPEYLSTHRNNGAPPFASTNPMAQGNMLPSPYYEEMRLAHIAPLRPKAVQALTTLLREQARAQLDLMLPRGKFDLSLDYAAIVPARMICHLYHLPFSIADQMMSHIRGLGSAKAGEKSIDISAIAREVRPYVMPLIEGRRAAGADGSHSLIDGLINYRVQPDQRALSNDEISNQLFCVMVGGLEAVPKIIARGIMELWRRPEQLKAVRADLEKNVPIAVEEIIRFCAPAVYTFRTAHRDAEIAGQPIKAGQRVVAMLNCASRDEREFPEPDEFIWDRSIPRVLSFGLGQHHCIGKHLALLEVRTLIYEFLARVKAVEFFPDDGSRNTGYFQRGYLSLPVVVSDYIKN